MPKCKVESLNILILGRFCDSEVFTSGSEWHRVAPQSTGGVVSCCDKDGCNTGANLVGGAVSAGNVPGAPLVFAPGQQQAWHSLLHAYHRIYCLFCHFFVRATCSECVTSVNPIFPTHSELFLSQSSSQYKTGKIKLLRAQMKLT